MDFVGGLGWVGVGTGDVRLGREEWREGDRNRDWDWDRVEDIVSLSDIAWAENDSPGTFLIFYLICVLDLNLKTS